MPNILQLKITLRDIEPKIWRRFLVSDRLTFDKLHEVIQEIMGWDNYHLYEFKFGAIRIILSDEGYLEENEIDPEKVKIYEYLNKEKQKCEYIYDFGDTWEHEIIIERIIPDKVEDADNYPKCIDGERACPPEDCGGTGGYERLIEVLKTGKDSLGENAKELKEWLGEWNPEKFDTNEINKSLQLEHITNKEDIYRLFVPLKELILEDNEKIKEIKSLYKKEVEYMDFLGPLEFSMALYYLENKKLKDVDIIRILRKIKQNYDRPLDFFNDELEKMIMSCLSLSLQKRPITRYELFLIIGYILWSIDNRKHLKSSRVYLNWLLKFFGERLGTVMSLSEEELRVPSLKQIKETREDSENFIDELWSEGSYIKSINPKDSDYEEKMKYFEEKSDEKKEHNCKKCNKAIGKHNLYWHENMCNNCFFDEYNM